MLEVQPLFGRGRSKIQRFRPMCGRWRHRPPGEAAGERLGHSRSAGLRTIFAQKAGPSDRAAAYGQEARLDSYYLNFRYGPCQVTISGYAATPETLAAIRELAATVDKRLRRD